MGSAASNAARSPADTARLEFCNPREADCSRALFLAMTCSGFWASPMMPAMRPSTVWFLSTSQVVGLPVCAAPLGRGPPGDSGPFVVPMPYLENRASTVSGAHPTSRPMSAEVQPLALAVSNSLEAEARSVSGVHCRLSRVWRIVWLPVEGGMTGLLRALARMPACCGVGVLFAPPVCATSRATSAGSRGPLRVAVGWAADAMIPPAPNEPAVLVCCAGAPAFIARS